MKKIPFKLSCEEAKILIWIPCLEENRHRAVAAKDSRDHLKAHNMLRRLFPYIPEGACTEILEHGFFKGSGGVGRSNRLEDRLKIQLAVNAHIRHRLTQYDSLLAANKGQDAKFAAREMVYRQVQEIADSWRATSSHAQNPKTRTLRSKYSAATLEKNRQRRAQQSNVRIKSTDATQSLEGVLGQLRLNEHEEKAGGQVEIAQLIAQRNASRKARTASLVKVNQDLLHRYKLYPSIELINKKTIEALRLQREQAKNYRKTRGFPTFDNIPTISGTFCDGLQLGRKGLGILMPISDRSAKVDTPDQSCFLLRSSHRTSDSTPMNNDRFSNDVQLQQKEHESHVPVYVPTPNTHLPQQSCSLRRNRVVDFGNESGGSPFEKSEIEGGQSIKDSEWMDIDDIPSETAGMDLA